MPSATNFASRRISSSVFPLPSCTPTVRLRDSAAESVAYDVPSILTGARTWVRGHADTGEDADDAAREFTLFVKRVHNWRHSPAFTGVPP